MNQQIKKYNQAHSTTHITGRSQASASHRFLIIGLMGTGDAKLSHAAGQRETGMMTLPL